MPMVITFHGSFIETVIIIGEIRIFFRHYEGSGGLLKKMHSLQDMTKYMDLCYNLII